jgi:hypothetical protein
VKTEDTDMWVSYSKSGLLTSQWGLPCAGAAAKGWSRGGAGAGIEPASPLPPAESAPLRRRALELCTGRQPADTYTRPSPALHAHAPMLPLSFEIKEYPIILLTKENYSSRYPYIYFTQNNLLAFLIING